MAPLLVPLLLSLLFYTNAKDLSPDAEKVIGRYVPDVSLTLEDGSVKRLSEVSEGKVLLLSFIYTKCSSACPMIVRGIEEATKDIGGVKVLLLDFDERDKPKDLKKFRELKGIKGDWVLALAKGKDLERLTEAVDFKFFYDKKTDMFAHPSVLIVLSPDLRVSAYFLGVSYEKGKLKKAVKGAYAGEISQNPIKSLLLICFRYDPVTGTYTVDWSFVAMVLGGLIPISGMLYYLFLRNFFRSIYDFMVNKSLFSGGERS